MSIQIQTSLNRLNPNVPCFLKPYVEKITAPVNIITLAYHPNGFLFDEDYAKMVVDNGRPVVVLNYREYGWEQSWKNFDVPWVMGGTGHPMYESLDERIRLDGFLRNLGDKYLVCFQREFSKEISRCIQDVGPVPLKIFPIELLSPNLPHPPEPNKEEYLSRPTDVFHWYGISHPDRMVMRKALEGSGLHVNCQEIHHTERKPLMDVMSAQSKCRASMSLSGAGHKVFRLSESAWNSVPIIDDVGMEYRVKWDDSNAIMLPTKDGRVLIEESLNKIQACLDDKEGMWERMLNAHENAKRMHIYNYMAEINQEILSKL